MIDVVQLTQDLADARSFAEEVNDAVEDYSADDDESGKAARRLVDAIRKAAARYRRVQ